MITALFINTKFTYYSILKKRLLENNDKFTVHLTSDDSCYEGKPEQQVVYTNFITWANNESLNLDIQGSTISVDESIFQGFPSQRPINCSGIAENWTHPEYWDKKQSDYGKIKKYIDNILLPLEVTYNEELKKAEQMAIDEGIRLVKEEKQIEIDEVNRKVLLAQAKVDAEQKIEDDRIFDLLSRLQTLQPSAETSSSPFNLSTGLIAGGLGLGLLLLVGLKR